jgi:predicted Zn-dependent protease
MRHRARHLAIAAGTLVLTVLIVVACASSGVNRGAGTFAKFGRDAEREADQLGVNYMYAAGYDPYGMVTMFQELLSRRQNQPGAVDKFFSSHPLTEERIESVRAQIQQLPPRENLIARDAQFPRIQQRLAGYGR